MPDKTRDNDNLSTADALQEWREAERDLAVSVSFSNVAMRVVSSCRLGQANHALGRYDRAADLLRQIVVSLQGDLVQERFGMVAFPSVWARSWLAWSLAERGEFAEALVVGEEGSRIAEGADDLYSRAQAAFGLGMLHLLQGRSEQAIDVLEEGLVIARLASIPFIVPWTSRAPASTATSEFATPQPASSWVWMPTWTPSSSATTAAVASETSAGSDEPFVSQSVTFSAPASAAARRQRSAYAGSSRHASKKCSAS